MRRVTGSLIMAVAIVATALHTADAVAAVGGCGPDPDFDGDGRVDTAAGVPGEDSFSGAVHVIYGSADGLTASGDQIFRQGDLLETPEEDDRLGDATAAGDFNGDGFTDLAVGARGENVAEVEDGGVVHVIYGSAAGLTTSGDQLFHQSSSGMADSAEADDEFGADLTSGDFDNDGRCDLAVGVPGQIVSGFEEAGAVHLIYGSASGLTASGDHVIHQDVSGVADDTADGDRFGDALASGDFDADGRDDLAVGMPQSDTSGSDSGSVHFFYGSATGITASGDAFFHQDSSGMTDAVDEEDEFGAALSSGDFDNDGRDDLGIGVPGELVQDEAPPTFGEGAVHVMYGSAAGLTASGDQFLHQDSPGMADAAEGPIFAFEPVFSIGDRFGAALTSGDFDNDGRDDLGVGVPGEDLEGETEAETRPDVGAIHVIYGSSDGLTASGDQFIHQDTSGIADQAEGAFVEDFFGFVAAGDAFGSAVSAGDFDADGRDDIAVGVPLEDLSEDLEDNQGAVHVIYGSSTGLTASGDQFIHQDTTGITDAAEPDDTFGRSLPGSRKIPSQFPFSPF